MSQIREVLKNMKEYSNLMQFIYDNYPQVLEEWKNKTLAYQASKSAGTHTTGTLANSEGDKIY
jgi:hypothetical protein